MGRMVGQCRERDLYREQRDVHWPARPVQKCLNSLLLPLLSLAILLHFPAQAATSSLPAGEARFATVDPIAYDLMLPNSMRERTPFLSSPARIFFSFHPADLDKDLVSAGLSPVPIFVFVNGGPGCPTCNGLLSLNTAPKSLDPLRYDNGVGDNPSRWSRLGHLLYVDAPNSGYSYNLAVDPSTRKNRNLEFTIRNFNPYIDAAQVVRVLLEFLDTHAEYQKNPIILVGESYGGTRTTIMLDMLLHPEDYDDGGSSTYHDVKLVDLINKHHAAVVVQPQIEAEDRAQQFGRQILIEPQLTGSLQTDETGKLFEKPGSIIYQINPSFKPCGNRTDCNPYVNGIKAVSARIADVYQVDWPIAKSVLLGTVWMDSKLLRIEPTRQLFSYDPSQIQGMKNTERLYSYNGSIYEAYRVLGNFDRFSTDKIIRSPKFSRKPAAYRGYVALIQSFENRLSTLIRKMDRLSQKHDLVPAGEQTFKDVFGALPSWDGYFVDCGYPVIGYFIEKLVPGYSLITSMNIYDTFYNDDAVYFNVTPESKSFGGLFLKNLPLVKAMITNASKDVIIYPPAIPPSFKRYSNLVADVGVKSLSDDQKCKDNPLICDANIVVRYQQSAAEQKIYFPYYAAGGHAVSWLDDAKLFKDVRLWAYDK